MQYASNFKLGIQKDNLPAGFYLTCDENNENSLILCFSEKQKKIDLINNKSNNKEKNNFKIKLIAAKSREALDGNYRSLNIFSANTEEQKILYNIFQIENSSKSYSEEQNSAEQEQSQIEYKNALLILNKWSNQRITKFSVSELEISAFKETLDFLFVNENTKFSLENLQSLGQIFKNYDFLDKEEITGIDNFLIICNKIRVSLGNEIFNTWKERCLDPVSNWQECLAEDNVRAIYSSISYLQNNDKKMQLWHILLDAHGKSVGYMHYENLWNGFKELMSYLDEKQLQIDENKLIQYLENTKDFNALTFMDRLHFSLKNAAIHSITAQKNILNNIEFIDWKHNGFYYACRYNGYNYWHETLKLTQLQTTLNNDDEPKYSAIFFNKEQHYTNSKLHALRVMATNTNTSVEDFTNFQKLIDSIDDNNYEILSFIENFTTQKHSFNLQNNCIITDNEINEAIDRFSKELNPIYAEDNIRLFSNIIKHENITINTSEQLNEFIISLNKISSITKNNELTIFLGMINEYMKTNSCSIAELTKNLNLIYEIIQKNSFKLVKIVLNDILNNTQNLNTEIILNESMPNALKVNLCKLLSKTSLQSYNSEQSEEIYNKIKNTVKLFNDINDSPPYIKRHIIKISNKLLSCIKEKDSFFKKQYILIIINSILSFDYKDIFSEENLAVENTFITEFCNLLNSDTFDHETFAKKLHDNSKLLNFLQTILYCNVEIIKEHNHRFFDICKHASYLLGINTANRSENMLQSEHLLIFIKMIITGKQEQKINNFYQPQEANSNNILRVLNDIKRKNSGTISESEKYQLVNLLYFINTFSENCNLYKLSSYELGDLILKFSTEAKKYLQVNEGDYAYTAAKLLACIQAIFYQTTGGKLPNSTQMIAIIYFAINPNKSSIGKIKTGQGKSIVSSIIAAYYSILDNTVDLLSSKTSLSERDSNEFRKFFEELSINHNYITAKSPANSYQDSKAVHYATSANMSLYRQEMSWHNKQNVNSKQSICFLDEADHMLLDENTQYNHAVNEYNSEYNYDAWVYIVVYEYFNQNKFERSDDDLIIREKHRRELCKILEDKAMFSPEQSQFMTKYINPAISGNKKDIERRDEMLNNLLKAQNAASNLKEGHDFCIASSDSSSSDRCAKVMINMQVKEGAIYSELVHQFLHTRLNEEAIKKGETPNFAIPPVSNISSSLQIASMLPFHYRNIKGLTGTTGNTEEIEKYSNYGIDEIIKFPPHKESRSLLLPTVYASSYDDQIENICEQILKYENQPILITCKDDTDVKKIALSIEEYFQANNLEDRLNNFIIDTNDTEIKESKVSTMAGSLNAITVSARMGRGTDIKPETDEGLMVLRTYPAMPRIVKQENGRQGRNGSKGIYQDIINYAEIEKNYNSYLNKNKEFTEEIYHKEERHLEKKLNKLIARKKTEKHKFYWLENKNTKEKYLKTRTLQKLNYYSQENAEKYINKKNKLLSDLGLKVLYVLNSDYYKKEKLNKLKDKWIYLVENFHSMWNTRFNGEKIHVDNENIYAKFVTKIENEWKILRSEFRHLENISNNKKQNKVDNLPKKKKITKSVTNDSLIDKSQKEEIILSTITLFETLSSNNMDKQFLHESSDEEKLASFSNSLQSFHTIINNLINSDISYENKIYFIKNLNELLTINPNITIDNLTKLVTLLSAKENLVNINKIFEYLKDLFSKLNKHSLINIYDLSMQKHKMYNKMDINKYLIQIIKTSIYHLNNKSISRDKLINFCCTFMGFDWTVIPHIENNFLNLKNIFKKENTNKALNIIELIFNQEKEIFGHIIKHITDESLLNINNLIKYKGFLYEINNKNGVSISIIITNFLDYINKHKHLLKHNQYHYLLCIALMENNCLSSIDSKLFQNEDDSWLKFVSQYQTLYFNKDDLDTFLNLIATNQDVHDFIRNNDYNFSCNLRYINQVLSDNEHFKNITEKQEHLINFSKKIKVLYGCETEINYSTLQKICSSLSYKSSEEILDCAIDSKINVKNFIYTINYFNSSSNNNDQIKFIFEFLSYNKINSTAGIQYIIESYNSNPDYYISIYDKLKLANETINFHDLKELLAVPYDELISKIDKMIIEKANSRRNAWWSLSLTHSKYLLQQKYGFRI